MAEIDFSNWKLTLPVDSSGGFSGTAVEIKTLAGYEHAKYFYTGSDGAMVTVAPVEGATTQGSNYARSELREMLGTDRAAWKLSQGGQMVGTLEVDVAPTLDSGASGRVIFAQIHGADDELVRFYWEGNQLYFKNDQAGSSNSELRFDLFNSAGQRPNVSLNEKFSYSIDAEGSSLVIKVWADGDVYTSSTKINDVWQSDTFYFKAGTYLGTNETQGEGYGQTSYFDLRFTHGDEQLSPVTDGGVTAPAPLPITDVSSPPPPPPPPEEDAVAAPSDGFYANWPSNVDDPTAGLDAITGTTGADNQRGGSGNDVFVASKGADIYDGGAGVDTVSYEKSAVRVSVDMDKSIQSRQSGDSSYDQLKNIDNLWGSEYNDRFYGNAGDNLLAGGKGDDLLSGDKGNDTLIGGVGSDTLQGGSGADLFVFTPDDGNDVILGFSRSGGDKLAFIDVAGIDSVADVLAHAQTSGSNVLITLGDDVITLQNTSLSSLQDAVFVY